MEQNLAILLLATLGVGTVHTLLGPDHYVPFIALARSRGWSLAKTLGITAACGVGHLLSALGLGAAAASAGAVLARLGAIEEMRGSLAAWLLAGFGLAYGLWGLRQALRQRRHELAHASGAADHTHGAADAHPAGHHHLFARRAAKRGGELTPWVLFIIFILGPCEPLIPLIMYPAARGDIAQAAMVTLTFGLATLAAMLAVVGAACFGLRRLAGFAFFERYGAAMAGGIICACGLSITFLGL